MYYDDEPSVLHMAKSVLNTLEEDERYIIKNSRLFDTYTTNVYTATPKDLLQLFYTMTEKLYNFMKEGGMDD